MLVAVVLARSPSLVEAAATPLGPFEVDLSDREAARQFFYSVYLASENIPIGWTGDIASCDPGTVSADYLDATLTRINYFRAMAGVPSDVTFTAENNAKAQATALIMSAQRALSHDPPMDWRCWTQLGRDGAATSNLSQGNAGPDAIDALVKDGHELGHRRTMLNPQILSMGSGSVPATANGDAAEAQLMVDNPSPPADRRPARDEFVAWPPKGFVPYQVVYPLWSFVLRDADFANASVTMRRPDGTPVPVTITTRVDFAGPGVVWLVDGMSESCQGRPQPCTERWSKPAADEPITVTLSNVVVAGVARELTYTVTVFDPSVADRARLAVTGPTEPPLNQASTYRVGAFPGSSGYQWRTTKPVPFELTDAAENLDNVDTRIGGYDAVSSNFAASGTTAFRLTTGSPGGVAGSGPQTLTFKQELIPSADSQLTFKTRARLLDNVTAVAEVSPDNGVSWIVIAAKQADNDTAFVEQAPSLAAFAGQPLRLRFRVQNAGTGGTFFGGSEGWYIDDIAFRGFERADAPVLSEVTAGPAFDLTPTEPSLFDIQVRVQFVSSVFGPWGPPLRVSTLPAATAPTITTQPQGVTVTAGENAQFTAAVRGTLPMTLTWSREGTDLVDGPGISGSRTTILSLTNVQAADAGAYRVRVTNRAGTVESDAATLTVNAAPPPPPPEESELSAALDGRGLQWTTSGDASWAAQTAVTHDGTDAAQSGRMVDFQSGQLETTVNGPATLSFWWKVDSESFFDFLTVTVDGAEPIPGISGDVDWQRQTLAIPAGAHSVRFTYAKDESVSVGRDAAWVDEISLE